MFKFVNIGTNSLKKTDWQHQSTKYVASIDNKSTQIFYGNEKTSQRPNIAHRILSKMGKSQFIKSLNQFKKSMDPFPLSLELFDKLLVLVPFAFHLFIMLFNQFNVANSISVQNVTKAITRLVFEIDIC